jgi:hypothetical protein
VGFGFKPFLQILHNYCRLLTGIAPEFALKVLAMDRERFGGRWKNQGFSSGSYPALLQSSHPVFFSEIPSCSHVVP